jgi:hypothetical protein
MSSLPSVSLSAVFRFINMTNSCSMNGKFIDMYFVHCTKALGIFYVLKYSVFAALRALVFLGSFRVAPVILVVPAIPVGDYKRNMESAAKKLRLIACCSRTRL